MKLRSPSRRPGRLLRLSLTVLLLGAAGCPLAVAPDEQFPCEGDADCALGYLCGSGALCLPENEVERPDDAGVVVVDGGEPEPPADAGPPPADAGPADAGVVDAGMPDDAGTPADGGAPVDAGMPDAGTPVDAGLPIDAGVDAGVVDPQPPVLTGAPIVVFCERGEPCTFDLGALGYASDADTPLSEVAVEATGGPRGGTLDGVADNLTYTPNPEHTGEDPFELRLSDGNATSARRDIVIYTRDRRTCLTLHESTGERTPSGVHDLNPDGEGLRPTYCDMTENGGGWALVLKTASDTGNYGYTDPHWEDAHVDAVAPDVSRSEAKLDAFVSHPIEEVRVVFSPLTATGDVFDQHTSVVLDVEAASMRELMNRGYTPAGGANTNDFLALQSGSNIQQHCDMLGFNVDAEGPTAVASHRRTRIGVIGNNEESCVTTDSSIGVGGAGGVCSGGAPAPLTHGTYHSCGDGDDISAGTFVSVWVRAADTVEVRSSCTAHWNALRRNNGFFYVDADGALGPFPPQKVVCLNDYDGGGWMVVARSASTVLYPDFGWKHRVGTVDNTDLPFSLDLSRMGVPFSEVATARRNGGWIPRDNAYAWPAAGLLPSTWLNTATVDDERTARVVLGDCQPSTPSRLGAIGWVNSSIVYYFGYNGSWSGLYPEGFRIYDGWDGFSVTGEGDGDAHSDGVFADDSCNDHGELLNRHGIMMVR